MQFRRALLIILVTLSFLSISFADDPIVLEHGGAIQSMVASPTHNAVFVTAGDDNTIKLWDLHNKILTTFTGHLAKVNDVAISPNGELLASGSDDQTFKLWSIPQQQHIATLEHIPFTDASPSSVISVAFSPDGKTLATAGYRSVVLWNVDDQTEIGKLEHDDWVWVIDFSHDGNYLATDDGIGTSVKVWNIQRKRIVTTLKGHTTDINYVKFSPDGRTLASSSWDGEIKLWAVRNWKLLGTFHSQSTAAIDFSPDGKTLASGGREEVTLWSVDSGENIATLQGHTGWIRGIAFSSDGSTLASSAGSTIRIQNIKTLLESQGKRDMVRLVYFVPTDRTPQSDIDTKLDTLMKATQKFFSDEMKKHGYGRKTFTFETDTTGKAMVYHIIGRFTHGYYRTNTIAKVKKEIEEQFDASKNIYLIVTDINSQVINDGNTCGIDGSNWKDTEAREQGRDLGRHIIIPASDSCFSLNVIAHELGHAFGLAHDFRSDTYLMSYGLNPDQLSHCATEWLDAHRYFNTSETSFNEPTMLEMLTPFSLSPNKIRFRFRIADADGLHQAQLIVPTAINDSASGTKLHGCKSVNSETNLIEFITTELTISAATIVTLKVIDVHGNITQQTYPIRLSDIAHVDVNNDGVVDTVDLVLVASHFRTHATHGANPNPDVNNDGFVDREDLILVVDALESEESTAAAPALTTTNLQHWILEAKRLNPKDVTFQRGIIVLEQLLTSLPLPKETTLLSNYPNPFNPETWIPYQLAKPAEVSISIYTVEGKLVRTLDLGHQSGGIYESRSRAAYWDGKNKLGETVASGVYFYTLTAGNFTDTRKMLIRK